MPRRLGFVGALEANDIAALPTVVPATHAKTHVIHTRMRTCTMLMNAFYEAQGVHWSHATRILPPMLKTELAVEAAHAEHGIGVFRPVRFQTPLAPRTRPHLSRVCNGVIDTCSARIKACHYALYRPRPPADTWVTEHTKGILRVLIRVRLYQ